MTSETRTLIELKDVLGIEYGCPHCGTKLENPITRQDAPPNSCPACNKPWFGNMDMQNRTVGGEQLRSLARVIGLLTAERGDIAVQIKLHIANSQKAA